ncbi:MAG: TIGR03668 family PPOX class F420-dependent oxidoreductase [Acidimicrobiales bacterium]
MDADTLRRRAAEARVGRLATIGDDGAPHQVPCCFVLDGDTLYTAVDDVKAKRTARLRRLDNVRAHPVASLLVDHYDEDWSQLWWIRLDGAARVLEPDTDEAATARALLAGKYEQYRAQPPPGAVIAVDVERWRAWP